jgi:hypothetical protein
MAWCHTSLMRGVESVLILTNEVTYLQYNLHEPH